MLIAWWLLILGTRLNDSWFIPVLQTLSEGPIWSVLCYNIVFIYLSIKYAFSCVLQIFHDLEVNSDKIFETSSSFYSEKDVIPCHCDVNYITIMTLQRTILLTFSCVYHQHSITEMFLTIPYVSIFDSYGDCNLCVLEVNVFYPFSFLHCTCMYCSASMLGVGIYVHRL